MLMGCSLALFYECWYDTKGNYPTWGNLQNFDFMFQKIDRAFYW